MSETEGAPFGTKQCDVPGYEDCWVRFALSGYPRRLRREWMAADYNQTWAIVMRYVTAWQVRDIPGQAVELPPEQAARAYEIVDDVEEAVVGWLVRSFSEFWLRDLPSPRPNS